MVKFLPFIIIPILLVLGFGAWSMFGTKSNTFTSNVEEKESVTTGLVEVPKSLPEDSSESKIQTLQTSVDTLVKEVNALKTTNTDLNVRVKSLETVDIDVATRVTKLETTTTLSVSTTSSTQPTIFIPLGAGGSWGNQDWYTLVDYEVSLDPASFPGYKGMVLEANFRMTQAAGTASVRLFNITDNKTVSGEISTTSDSFSLGTSSSFILPAGNKVYKLQMKSTAGSTVMIDIARIRVNF